MYVHVISVAVWRMLHVCFDRLGVQLAIDTVTGIMNLIEYRFFMTKELRYIRILSSITLSEAARSRCYEGDMDPHFTLKVENPVIKLSGAWIVQ